MWRWLATAFIFICLIAAGIMLEKPKGNIVGNVYLQKPVWGGTKTVYTTDNILKANARVVVYGPVTRGSYVDSKGEFKINGLPLGKYRLLVKANGYSSKTKWDIEVKESKNTRVETMKLNYLSASLSLASDTKVFTSDEKPYFWMRSTAIDNVDVKLYTFDPVETLANMDKKKKSDFAGFLLGNYYYGSDNFVNEIVKGKKPIKKWDKKVSYDSSDYGSTPLKLDDELPEGSYLMIAEGKSFIDDSKRQDAYWFYVTKMGIITKHDHKKLFVRAVNLETLESVENAIVKIYDRYDDYKFLGLVKTNKDGIAEFDFTKDFDKSYTSLLVVANKDDSLALNGAYSWYYSEDRYKVYMYTDRPIYRPNQTVYFKGIVRQEVDGELKTLAGEPVKLTVYNPDDEPIKTIKLSTNKFGTYNAYIDVTKNAMLGSYRIKSEINSNEFSNYFEVAEYRKPEYKVDVIPGSEMLIGGDKATATIKANYFFGYPVTNAKVKYTVYASPNYGMKWKLLPRPTYYSYYDDWDEDDSYYYYGHDYGSSTGDVVAEGYATTDENGEAKITFKTKKFQSDTHTYYSYYDSIAQTYKVEAEVTDISRKTAVGKGSFDVVSGEFAMFVDPEYYVYTEDQDIRVNVDTIGYNKEPVSADVKVVLQSWEWDSKNWAYKNPKVLSEAKVRTDKKGEGVAILDIPKNTPTDDYRIVVYSEDSAGNQITAMTYVWVSNFKYPGRKRETSPKLELTFDKKVYQPGDTAKVMLVTPVKDTQALVCVEGTELYDCKLVQVTDNTQLLEVPLTKKYVPNAYLSVIMVGPRKQYLSQVKMIKVSPNTNFLNIDLQPNKTKYKPQEEVTYDIKTTDSEGRPVQAELSIAIVDESIFAIRSDYTPDIRKFFYKKKTNLVHTTYSFYKSYSAGADKIEPKLRKDFKDTAFWRADVVTDKNGKARVKFKLPDNLTTWRATVRAVTKDTKVGSKIDNILVTKDIIVRLALPRFYTVGDKAILASIVHNYTDKEQNIKVDLKLPSNFKLLGGKSKPSVFVQVPSQDKVRQDWKVEAKASGKVKVRVYARSTEVEGDALEKPIEILPYGVHKNSLKSGKLIDDEATETIQENITEKIVPGSLNWVVRISPSNASLIFGSLDYLIQYPYGCVEQTMSRFMPSIVVANVSKNLGVTLRGKAKAKLPEVVDDSLTRLYKFQHYDGGWGWWEKDDSHGYMTAYVLLGLKYAVESGYKIEQDRIKRGVEWLEKHLNSKEAIALSENKAAKEKTYHTESLSNLAYECYVLTMFGKKNNTIMENLYKRKEHLANQTLSYLALAYAELGKDKEANILLDTLMERINVSGSIISFSMTNAILEKLGISLASMYSYNDLEVAAISMRAMLRIRPDDPMVERIVPLLIDRRHGNYWYNTKTTATIIHALSEYIKYSADREDPDYSVVVKLDDREIKTLKFNRSNMFSPEAVVEIPVDLIDGSNTVTLEKTGTGKMYYSSDFNYYQFFEPDETIPAIEDNNIIIKKELYRLKSKTDKDGNIQYEKELLTGPVNAGEILLIKLEVVNKKFGQYILIEDPKASGMEVVAADPSSKLGSSFDDDNDTGYWWWNHWWTHQEDRDTHMAFFITSFNPGVHEFYYLVRPELPGEYLIRPTAADGMYSSEISGSSSSLNLKVRE